MILTDKVVMKWNPSNREHYISKGYKFTKWHEKFIIPIADLSPSSNILIDIKCDYCGSDFQKRYGTLSNNNKTGKHSCEECLQIRLTENKKIEISSSVETLDPNVYERHYRIDINDKIIFLKMCKTCGKHKELSCFRDSKKGKIIEYYNQCTECDKDFAELNKMQTRLYHIKETSVRIGLITPMTKSQLESVFERFKEKCALTDSVNVVCEHFIPVSWGHGGTYLGNIYLLKESLNMSKGSNNPFEWIKRKKLKSRLVQRNGIV